MQRNHHHLLKTRGKGKLVSGFSPKMEVQSSVAACDDDRQHLLPDTQQQEQDRQEEREPQQQQQQQEHFHVLAVDDSVIDRKLLERLLKVSSYQVTCVESGDKALEYLGLLDNLDNSSSTTSSSSSVPQSAKQEGMKVNLIMTDYCMPGISGYDLLKRVKGSSWKDVPVVVMSSENIPSRISMCLEGGAEQFLLKPLQLSDVEKLQYYLLKSPDHDDTCKRIDNNTNDFSTEGTDNRSSNYSNVTPKRKAASSDPQERVPKMKGVFDLGALELHLLPNTVRSKFGDQI